MPLYGDIVVLVAHSLNNIVRKVILKKEQKKKKIQLEGAWDAYASSVNPSTLAGKK